MITVSIVMNTCRDDFPMVGLPNTFIFEPTVRSLNRQTVKDFELIIVDACYSPRRLKWLEENTEFPFKYINAFPNRFLENGLVAISSMKNRGLLYVDGELVVFMDDCTEYPRKWVERILYWYGRGYWPMSLTYYYEGGRPKVLSKSDRYFEVLYGREVDKTENLFKYVKPGEIVRDSRADMVNARGTLNAPASWFYGGSSAELSALLDINGIDERFDGSKGLEDADTGIRLEMAGYGGMFILDKELWHVEHWHKPISERVLFYKGPTPKCNYALLQYNQLKNSYRANTSILSYEDCLWIRDNICPKCPNLGRCVNEEFRGRFFIDCDAFHKWLK
ncbi:MAG: hypothetical protein DRP01_10530, partial [Archaeoglobales archaeon]